MLLPFVLQTDIAFCSQYIRTTHIHTAEAHGTKSRKKDDRSKINIYIHWKYYKCVCVLGTTDDRVGVCVFGWDVVWPQKCTLGEDQIEMAGHILWRRIYGYSSSIIILLRIFRTSNEILFSFFFFYWPNIHPLEEDFHRKSWAIKLLYFLFPRLQSVHPTHANTSHRYWSNEQKWKKKQKNRSETLCVSGRFAIYAYRIHTRWYLCATRAVAIQFYYFLKKEQRKKIVDNKNNFYFFIDSGSVFRYIYVCPECLYVLDCASCCSLPSSMEWDVGREHTEWVSEREVRFLSL